MKKCQNFEKSTQKNFTKIILSFFVAFFLVCMIANPAKFIEQSLDGLSAWTFSVLPSVLPFMFFTKVLSSLDTISALTRPFSPLSRKLFKTPPISIYTFCMAILSGYPVGSKMVADLYLQGKISRQEAFKMTSFCSTSGPMFIVGAVGVGMFNSSKIGYILFISHIIGALLNGVLYRNLKGKENAKNETQNDQNSSSCENENNICMDKINEKFADDEIKKCTDENNQKDKKFSQNKVFNLSDIVLNSVQSILSVGCIITIFFIVIACFSPLFSLLPQTLANFLEGIIEITKGCIDLSTLSNTTVATILCSFVISFGGISTILQSLTMLNSVKMPVKLFVLQKFTHACLSTIVTILLVLIL